MTMKRMFCSGSSYAQRWLYKEQLLDKFKVEGKVH